MPSRKKINKLKHQFAHAKKSAKSQEIVSSVPGIQPSVKKNINELTSKFAYNRTFKDISRAITEHTPGGFDLTQKPKPIKKKKNENFKRIRKHKPWSSHTERAYFESRYFKWTIHERHYDPHSRVGSASSTPTIIKGVEVEKVIPGSKRAKELFREAKKFAEREIANNSSRNTRDREFDVVSCSWFQEDYLSSGPNNNSRNRVSDRNGNNFTTENDLRTGKKVKPKDFVMKSVSDLIEYENMILDRHQKHKYNYIQDNDNTTRNTRECLNYGEVCDTNDDECCDDLYCEEYDNTCHSHGDPDVLGQPFWWNAIDYVLRGKCDGQVMPDGVDCDEDNPNYERRPFVCGHSLGGSAGGGYGCWPLHDYDQDGIISLVDVQAIMCQIEPNLFCRNPAELCGCNATATIEQYDAYNWNYGQYIETLNCFQDQPTGEKDVWLCPSHFWNGGGDVDAYWNAGGTNPLGFPIESTKVGSNQIVERECGPAIWIRPNLNGGAVSNTTPPADEEDWDDTEISWAMYGINHPSYAYQTSGNSAWGYSIGRFGRKADRPHQGFFDALCAGDNACGRCGEISNSKPYGDCLVTLDFSTCPTLETDDTVPNNPINTQIGGSSGLPFDEYSLRNPYNPLNCWYTNNCEPGEQPEPNVSGRWLPHENETLVYDSRTTGMTRNPGYTDGFTMDNNFQEIK